jgi:hypothetical protein
MRVLATMTMCLTLLAACQRPVAPGPPETIVYLRTLTIEDRTPASTRPVTLDSKFMQRSVRESFSRAGLTLIPEGKPGPEQWSEFVEQRRVEGKRAPGTVWSVRVDLSVVYGLQSVDGVASEVVAAPGKLVIHGDAAIRLPGETESVHERFEVDAGGDFTGDASVYRKTLARWLDSAAHKVGQRVVEKVQIYELPLPKLIDLLSHQDKVRRLDAAERLSILRHRPAVKALSSRLSIEPDRMVKLRVIGALAEIGDDRAAKALIAAADPRDREVLRAILDALSVIGGSRVSEFFGIMAMHDSIEVRDLVEAAIRRLKRTQKQTRVKAGLKESP